MLVDSKWSAVRNLRNLFKQLSLPLPQLLSDDKMENKEVKLHTKVTQAEIVRMRSMISYLAAQVPHILMELPAAETQELYSSICCLYQCRVISCFTKFTQYFQTLYLNYSCVSYCEIDWTGITGIACMRKVRLRNVKTLGRKSQGAKSPIQVP